MLKSNHIRILVTEAEAYSQSTRECFLKSWDVTFAEIYDQHELVKVCSETSYDIIFGKLGLVFDKSIFELQPELKILVTPTTGLNHIVLPDAELHSIQILSLRGEAEFLSNVTSTAEHAWTLLLAINRSLVSAVSRVSQGLWKRQELGVHELSGSPLGLIGMGRLGRIVARYGLAFQMEVVGYDPHVASEMFPAGCKKVGLQELLTSSEYVVMLASYKLGDPPILGRAEFSRLRLGAVLINVARGELIDEKALLHALDDCKIRGFGTDVLVGDSNWGSSENFDSEIVERSKLDTRIIITPHMGGYAAEAIEKTRKFMVGKLTIHLHLENSKSIYRFR